MRTLLGERFAPITTSIGFVRVELDVAAQALVDWRRSLYGLATREECSGGLPALLPLLEPLTSGVRPRELLVEASDGWTAYFDCLLRGTDAVSCIGYLARTIGCQGLAIRAAADTAGLPGIRHGRMGTVQFEMFGPNQTDFLNYVRSIYASHDGSRWTFGATGAEQWFEEPEAYRARRVRDRFTSALLERYCRALDVDVFNADAYGPRAILVRSPVTPPPDSDVMSLQQVQQWLEIVPDMANNLPG